MLCEGTWSYQLFISVVSILETINAQGMAGGAYFGGIPVPGRRVPAISSFELYLSACRPSSQQDYIFDQIQQVLQNVDAEQIAEKMQRNLYFAVDEIDIEKLLGKWYTVVDSPSAHREHCVVTYFKLVEKGSYSAGFTSTQYSKNDENVKVIHGNGNKMGPDPANFLIHTGHPSDICPYFPIKVGPVNHRGHYEYIILTQALKHPTMVLARDVIDFNVKYSAEVHDYLDHYGYINPLAALNRPIHFVNSTSCILSNNYYANIDDDSTEDNGF